MSNQEITRCRDCSREFTYSPSACTIETPRGPVVLPPRRCPDCTAKRESEDEQLLAAALTDRSLAHAYRCRSCRRIFLLLRPWTRAGGLLFCPECRPAFFSKNPRDAELNRRHGYPRF